MHQDQESPGRISVFNLPYKKFTFVGHEKAIPLIDKVDCIDHNSFN